MKIIITLICCIFAQIVTAAEPPTVAKTSPGQELKKHFINGCVARGLQRNAEAVEVAQLCTCTFDVMSKDLTVQEYIEIDKASQERRSFDTLPEITRLKTKLLLCKK